GRPNGVAARRQGPPRRAGRSPGRCPECWRRCGPTASAAARNVARRATSHRVLSARRRRPVPLPRRRPRRRSAPGVTETRETCRIPYLPQKRWGFRVWDAPGMRLERPQREQRALSSGQPRMIVLGCREQVTVNVVGHLDRAMPEQVLQSLWSEPLLDPPRGEEGAQRMQRVFRLALLVDDAGLALQVLERELQGAVIERAFLLTREHQLARCGGQL